MAPWIILITLTLMVLFFIFYKKKNRSIPLSDYQKELLNKHIIFYQKLSAEHKKIFETKVSDFLSYVNIKAVNNRLEESDKILVASSAVIPVFYFNKWKYYNIKTVLIYPGTFNRDEYLTEGYDKNTLGMVGTGAMQHMMILSMPALHSGFLQPGKHNTGIHEFVHLLDKEDGDVDGVPGVLMPNKLHAEWNQLVRQTTEDMLAGNSDLDFYGTTTKAEFFSVVAEYFFNDPEEFKENHPELYRLYSIIFQIPIQQ